MGSNTVPWMAKLSCYQETACNMYLDVACPAFFSLLMRNGGRDMSRAQLPI